MVVECETGSQAGADPGFEEGGDTICEIFIAIIVNHDILNLHSLKSMYDYCITVEPPNKGHFRDTASVLVSEVVLFSEVKNILMLW